MYKMVSRDNLKQKSQNFLEAKFFPSVKNFEQPKMGSRRIQEKFYNIINSSKFSGRTLS